MNAKRWIGVWFVAALVIAPRLAHAAITMSPDPLDTGDVVVGASTPTATGTLSDSLHSSTVDLVVTGTCSGTGAGTFALSPDTNVSLGTDQAITLTYTPTARGQLTCTVNVNDNILGTTLATFQVKGTGIAPIVAVAPSAKAYGSVRANNAAPIHSASQVFSVTNNGDSDLVVSGITFSGQVSDYTVTSAACITTIAPSTSANCTVTFDPVAGGASSATMDVATNDPVTPDTMVALSGTGTNAVIAVTDPLAFGTVNQGSSLVSNIAIGNTGGAPQGPLGVTLATFTTNASGWFTFNGAGCAGSTTTCPLALSITNVPAQVPIKCAPPPNAMGTQVATVVFSSDTDDATNNKTTMSCTAGRADISVDMPSLAFGTQSVLTTSPAKTVTITNNGTINLTYSITVTGANPGQFAVAPGSGCVTGCIVGPGNTSTFDVTFTPTSEGAKSANAHIVSNDPDTNPLDLPLTGTGIAPDISGPASLPFGAVDVGKMSTTQTLTITNAGASTLTISSAGLTAGASDYTVLTGTLGSQMVAPSGTASWDLSCNPTTFGNRPGTFTISSNALNSPTFNVMLTCTGQQGILTVLAPSSFDFGGVRIGDTKTHDFTLKNTGNVAVNTITGSLDITTAGFSIIAPTFPIASLAAGATQIVTVQFAPQSGSDHGPVTATFSGVWGSSSTVTTTQATVDGSGQVAGYDFSPKPDLDFGNIRFDTSSTLTFTLTDTNPTPVTIETMTVSLGTALSGEFTITGQTHNGTPVALPFALTGLNDQLVVSVKCQPQNRVAMLSADVIVHSDLGTNPDRDVPLVANSTTAMLTLTPPTNVLDFGAVDMDGGPVTKTITLMNSGIAPLNTGNGVKSGPNQAAFQLTTVAAQVIQPGASFDVMVKYTPTVERPMNQFDTMSLMLPLTGIQGGPSSVTIMIQGRGIDRHIQAGMAPVFPDTFRNPGTAAPILPVTITNTGEATLSISAVMLTGDPIWQLVNPDPVDVPGLSSYDFDVKFSPTAAGKAPDGQLTIMNNDNGMPLVVYDLTGNGINRSVDMGPLTIDLGYTGIGIPVSVSERAPSELLRVVSMDGTNTFKIHAITIDGGDGTFAVDNPPTDVDLPPNATQQYDVTFTPNAEGEFDATATLYLDQDPTAQAVVNLKGRAVFIDAHGGGGCAAGHDLGAGMVLVLGVLLVRRRRALACALVVLAPAVGRAEPRNLDVSVFDPTPATTGTGFQLQSATVGTSGSFVATALVSYASDPLVLTSEQNEQIAIQNRTSFVLGGAYALFDRFELGARMPLYLQSGETIDPTTQAGTSAVNGTARGDLTLHAKAKLWRGGGLGGDLGLGAVAALTLPTATSDMFAGVDKPTGRVLGLLSLTPDAFDHRVSLGVNLGAVIRGKTQFSNVTEGSGVAFGLGVSYRLLDAMWLSGEVFGDALPSGRTGAPAMGEMLGPSSLLVTSEYLVGMHYRLARRLDLGVALGRGLISGIGAPAFRGLVMLSFAPTGGEPVANHRNHPGDADRDSDGDGIPDNLDKCPNEPEDKDGFQDEDGCPDPDNDHDGIPDAQDKCPNEPEDKDGFQDEDGCPDPDNDGDGIPDIKDKCPNEPEDKDGFQDADGCPDPDNDSDGIPDIKDRCPNEPETINGFQDDDGCPDKGDPLVVMSPDRLELLEAIQFSGGTKVAKASFNILGQVGATLRAHDELVRVRVTVHVQPSNKPDRDQEISDKRAQAVRDWLVQWGVAPQRLEAKGFGGTKPLVSPDQRGSALINDRLELIILERK